METLEFGKDPFVKILKKLRIAQSQGLWVEISGNGATNGHSDYISARLYFRMVQVVLTYEREGRKVFLPSSLRGTKVKIFDLLQSLELAVEQRCLMEIGNLYCYSELFGEIEVQDC